MSNRAKKTGPRPNGKPSRAEVGAAFNQAFNDIQQLRVALAWVTDLMIEKKLFSASELEEFFKARREQAEAAAKAPAEIQEPQRALPAGTSMTASPADGSQSAGTVVLTD